MQAVITLSDISFDMGDQYIFSHLDLTLRQGEKLVLLGRNGSGKSTLLKVLAGDLEIDHGEVARSNQHIFAYLPQMVHVEDSTKTTLDFCMEKGAEHWDCAALLEELGLDASAKISTASGGELRKAALVQLLAKDADVILLDEPTNHLDIVTIKWLEQQLNMRAKTMIVISHDRKFAENITDACIWLDRGQLHRVDVPLSAFETWQERFFEQEEVQKQKLDKLIAEETRWSHQGISARRTRNQGRLRRLQSLREERKQVIAPIEKAKLNLQEAQRSGKEVIKAHQLSYALSDGKKIVHNLTLNISRNDRIGIVGPNGVGKTTLLKLLTKTLKPDQGSVKHGTQLQTLWIDQTRSNLPQDKTIWEFLGEGSDHVSGQHIHRHVASYAQDFLFSSPQLRSPISNLSGGEQNRLSLAKALLQPCNLIILDEPTNDLDLETLDLLQEMLSDIQATLLIVSHDRDFLDKLTTSCLVFEGGGRITEYAGGFSDALVQGAKIFPEKKSQKPKKKQGQAKPKSTSIKKLSFKHQYALKTLPQEIEQLAQDIQDIEQQLSDPELYQKDYQRFEALSASLMQKKQLLEQKEEELLEIEILREELDQAQLG